MTQTQKLPELAPAIQPPLNAYLDLNPKYSERIDGAFQAGMHDAYKAPTLEECADLSVRTVTEHSRNLFGEENKALTGVFYSAARETVDGVVAAQDADPETFQKALSAAHDVAEKYLPDALKAFGLDEAIAKRLTTEPIAFGDVGKVVLHMLGFTPSDPMTQRLQRALSQRERVTKALRESTGEDDEYLDDIERLHFVGDAKAVKPLSGDELVGLAISMRLGATTYQATRALRARREGSDKLLDPSETPEAHSLDEYLWLTFRDPKHKTASAAAASATYQAAKDVRMALTNENPGRTEAGLHAGRVAVGS